MLGCDTDQPNIFDTLLQTVGDVHLLRKNQRWRLNKYHKNIYVNVLHDGMCTIDISITCPISNCDNWEQGCHLTHTQSRNTIQVVDKFLRATYCIVQSALKPARRPSGHGPLVEALGQPISNLLGLVLPGPLATVVLHHAVLDDDQTLGPGSVGEPAVVVHEVHGVWCVRLQAFDPGLR